AAARERSVHGGQASRKHHGRPTALPATRLPYRCDRRPFRSGASMRSGNRRVAPPARARCMNADPALPFWVPSRVLQRHLNRTATGNPDQDWLSHVRMHHLGETHRRVLVLNCGYGYLERALARQGGLDEILATDANVDLVANARLQAERLHLTRISYAVVDVECDPMPAGPWDAVFAEGLLHHVSELEGLLARIHAELS